MGPWCTKWWWWWWLKWFRCIVSCEFGVGAEYQSLGWCWGWYSKWWLCISMGPFVDCCEVVLGECEEWYGDKWWCWGNDEFSYRLEANGFSFKLWLLLRFAAVEEPVYLISCNRFGGVCVPPVITLDELDSSPSLSYAWLGDLSSAMLPWIWNQICIKLIAKTWQCFI